MNGMEVMLLLRESLILDINNIDKNQDVNVSISVNKPTEIYEIAPKIAKNLGLKLKDVSGDNYNNKQGIHYENLSFKSIY